MLCPVYGHELTPLSCPPSQGVSFRSFKGLIILSPYTRGSFTTPWNPFAQKDERSFSLRSFVPVRTDSGVKEAGSSHTHLTSPSRGW